MEVIGRSAKLPLFLAWRSALACMGPDYNNHYWKGPK